MTAALALARAVQRNETSALRAVFTADPAIARRFGIETRSALGAICVTDRAFPIPLLHRAVGFGVLSDANAATLDRIIRVFASRGLLARVEIAEGIAPAGAVRLLERAGFRRERERHHVHLLETAEVPAAPGLPQARIARAGAARFGRAVREGFEASGDLGLLFERASAAHLRAQPDRAVPLVAVVGRAVAGTGLLWLSPHVGGLYSGSVLAAYRGRGLQLALIAERIRIGLRRRRRIFTSQTAGDDASAHNLRDLGFRVLYEAAYFARQTA